MTDRNLLQRRLGAAFPEISNSVSPPWFVVDLDAFEANAVDLSRRAGGVPIRVASKSLRVPDLIRRVLAKPGFAGVLGYALAEALMLHRNGISNDILVAYPTTDRRALAQLLADPAAAAAITLMVDDPSQLELIDELRTDDVRRTTQVRVAIEIDAALRLGVGKLEQYLGVKRSPLFEQEAVLGFARTVLDWPGYALVGVMTYESQVAGVPDDVPGQRPKSAAIRRLKRASMSQLLERRAELRAGLEELLARSGATLEFWNAGGSGSLAETAADPSITELAAGSGLLVPGLFDHYLNFAPRPAAYFGVPVVRRPAPGLVTIAGGGFPASGTADNNRLPTPWLPEGLTALGLEGFGEVQTPLSGAAADALQIGEPVWLRHAKSGELFERGNLVHLLAGDRFVDTVPTYRGAGYAFG